jgi:uncharacterized protein YdcH (DUF465 family)
MDTFENLKNRLLVELGTRTLAAKGDVIEGAKQTAISQGTAAINSIKQFSQRQTNRLSQYGSDVNEVLIQRPIRGAQEIGRAYISPNIRGIAQGFGYKNEELPQFLNEPRKTLPGINEMTPEQKETYAKNKIGTPLARSYKAISLYEQPEYKIQMEQMRLNRPLTDVEKEKIQNENKTEFLQGAEVLSIPSNIVTPFYDQYKLDRLNETGTLTPQQYRDRSTAIRLGQEVNGQKPNITLNEAGNVSPDSWKYTANDLLDLGAQIIIPDPIDAAAVGIGKKIAAKNADNIEKLIARIPSLNDLIKEAERRGKVISDETRKILQERLGTKEQIAKYIRDEFSFGKFAGKSEDDVINYMESQIKRQAKEEAFNATKLGQFYNKIGNKLVDFTLPVERAVKQAIAKGIAVSDLENPFIQIGRVFRADDLADTFFRQNGMEDVVREFDNKEFKYFNQYLIAKRNVAEGLDAGKTGRELADDEAIVKKYENDERFRRNEQIVYDYFKNLANKMHEYGLIDTELKDYLLTKQDYVPFQRVFDKLEQDIMEYGGTGRPIGSISKQNIVYELKGSQRAIVDPLQTAIDTTRKIFKAGEVNQTGRLIGDLVRRGGIEGVIARNADNVLRRSAIYTELKELRKLQNQLNRTLRTEKGWARKLEREINALSREGVDVFNKTARKDGFTYQDEATQAKLQKLINRKQEWLSNLLTETYYDLSPTLDKLAKDVGFERLTKTQKKELIAKMTDQQVIDIISEVQGLSKAKQETLFRRTLTKNEKISQTLQEIRNLKDGMSLNNVVNSLIRERPERLEQIRKQIDKRAPVLESIMDDILDVTEASDLNKAYRKSLRDEASMLADLDTKNQATMSYLRNGVKETIIMDKDLVDALKKTNVTQLNGGLQIINGFSRLLKLGATTLNIPFAAADFVRNELGVAVYSGFKNSLLNPLNFFGSMFESVGKKGLYEEYLRQGVSGGLFTFERKKAPKTLNRIRATRSLKNAGAYYIDPRNAGDLVKAFENLVQSPSELSRYNVFKRKRAELLKQGLDEKTANVSAAEFARTALTDFARYGEAGKVLEAFFPYFNAGIQGTRAMIKMAKTDPVGVGLRFTMYLGAPQYASTIWNLSDPERRKAYNDIPESEKERNFIVILNNEQGGVDRNERGFPKYIAIPKPLQFAGVLNVNRKLAEGSYAFDSKTALDIFSNLVQTTTSLQVPTSGEDVTRSMASFIPPVARGLAETATNINFYTGQEINPDSMADRAEYAKFYDDTSYTLKELSKSLNSVGIEISPLKLENLIKTQTGGGGEQLLNAVDYIAYLKGEAKPEEIGGKSVIEKFGEVFYKARGGELLRKEKKEEQKQQQIEAMAKFGITQAFATGNVEEIAKYTPELTERQFNNLMTSIAKDTVGDQLTDKQRFLFNKSATELEEYAAKNPDASKDAQIAQQAQETVKQMEVPFDTGNFTFKPGSGGKSKAPKATGLRVKKLSGATGGRKRTPARPSLKVPSLRKKSTKSGGRVQIKASQIKPIKPTRKI